MSPNRVESEGTLRARRRAEKSSELPCLGKKKTTEDAENTETGKRASATSRPADVAALEAASRPRT